MSYSDKLKDPRWQKLRLEVLNDDGWRCQYCGDEKSTLHVHHFVYPKSGNPWESGRGDLITLCENCHKIGHMSELPVSANEIYGIITGWAMMNEECKLLVREINRKILING